MQTIQAIWSLGAKNAAKLFGFTRSGSSQLGRYARKFFAHREARQFVGSAIVALLTASFLIQNLSNIGGPLVWTAQAWDEPKTAPLIDVSTTHTVRVPVAYNYESRGFSWIHSGADLAVETGTAVYPVMDGKVEATNYDTFGYGKHVIIAHSNGYESIYGHLSQIEVTPGETVNINHEIGKSGSTGFSTGPHLHLEVRFEGTPVDPAQIVPGIH